MPLTSHVQDLTVEEQQDLIDKLVKEFRDILLLDDADAYRSAFMVLALWKGWSHAKIGRHIGITRSRVGQKEISYLFHASGKSKYKGQLPVLTLFIDESMSAQREKRMTPQDVEFPIEIWEDDKFAVGMLKRIANL